MMAHPALRTALLASIYQSNLNEFSWCAWVRWWIRTTLRPSCAKTRPTHRPRGEQIDAVIDRVRD